MNRPLAVAVILSIVAGTAVLAQHQTHSPYAGAEQRGIAALSEGDLAAIRAGEGWGLALPAELNGVPGPTHVLELAADIGLTPAQITEIGIIRDQMRASAIAAGERFVASEKALDTAFADGPPDHETLARLVEEAGSARAALRLAHLSAHLQTVPLLTADQVSAYNRLRGYGPTDPCDAVPEGHDPTMWRRHNGCAP